MATSFISKEILITQHQTKMILLTLWNLVEVKFLHENQNNTWVVGQIYQ
jgi:hypothetical protein